MDFMVIWIIITIFFAISKQNSLFFFGFVDFMLLLTILFNKPKKIKIKYNILSIFSIPSNLIYLYLIYKCNDFLWVYPYDETLVLALMGFYLYLLIYIFSEF